MNAWFSHIWNDEAAFKAFLRTVIRYFGGLVGALLSTGIVAPDVVGNDGYKIGQFLLVLSLALPSRPIDPRRQGGPPPQQVMPVVPVMQVAPLAAPPPKPPPTAP